MINFPVSNHLNLCRSYQLTAFTSSRRWLTTSLLKKYYAILNLKEGASSKDVKDSFLRLSKVYHPDNKMTGSHTKFVQLKEAYDALKDGPPAVNRTYESYSPGQNDYNRTRSYSSNNDYADYQRYAEFNQKYYSQRRPGFGGPFADSSRPWEDFQRYREYQKQSRGGPTYSSPWGTKWGMIFMLTSIGYIAICSIAMLFHQTTFEGDGDRERQMRMLARYQVLQSNRNRQDNLQWEREMGMERRAARRRNKAVNPDESSSDTDSDDEETHPKQT